MTEAIIGALLGLSTNVTTSMINDFKKHYEGEEVWECWPDEAIRNYELIQGERQNDGFPQGKDFVFSLLGYAYKNRLKFYVKAIKKFPNWIWYYSLEK